MFQDLCKQEELSWSPEDFLNQGDKIESWEEQYSQISEDRDKRVKIYIAKKKKKKKKKKKTIKQKTQHFQLIQMRKLHEAKERNIQNDQKEQDVVPGTMCIPTSQTE